MKKENKKKYDNLKSLYDNELIENTLNAYTNMEKIGFLSKKQLVHYKKILKKIKEQ